MGTVSVMTKTPEKKGSSIDSLNNITSLPVIPKNVDKILEQQETQLCNIKLTSGFLPVVFLPLKSKINNNNAVIALKIGKGEYKFELTYGIIEEHISKNIVSTKIKIQKSSEKRSNGYIDFDLSGKKDEIHIRRYIMIELLNSSKFNSHLGG